MVRVSYSDYLTFFNKFKINGTFLLFITTIKYYIQDFQRESPEIQSNEKITKSLTYDK